MKAVWIAWWVNLATMALWLALDWTCVPLEPKMSSLCYADSQYVTMFASGPVPRTLITLHVDTRCNEAHEDLYCTTGLVECQIADGGHVIMSGMECVGSLCLRHKLGAYALPLTRLAATLILVLCNPFMASDRN